MSGSDLAGVPEEPLHVGRLSVMGIDVRIAADQQALLDTALDAFDVWRTDMPNASAEIRLLLRSDEVEPPYAGDISIRVEGDRLLLQGGDFRGSASLSGRVAEATVPPRLVGKPLDLAEEVLDTLLLFLITRVGRIPLHASAIQVDGTAVLLAGASGSGKSTLAHHASTLGLPVLSEDTVYVQLTPQPGIWGFPGPTHLLAEETPLAVAEEGADSSRVRLRHGRLKVRVPLAAAGKGHALFAPRAELCLLKRGESVTLTRISNEQAVQAIIGTLAPGFDHFREQLPAAVQTLAPEGAWRLTLSADPREALLVLRTRFGRNLP